MNAKHVDLHNPMAADVLEEFAAEWAERARKAQEAIDALTSGARKSRAPRLERRRIGKADRMTLVRRDGDEARLLYGPEAKEVTVNFTTAEWDMITQVVFAQHGLTPITPLSTSESTDQEGTA
ncbi:hypothetical protein SEA_RAMIEL05_59 [Microbacterium phage Ramiel05]|uniref:Uncharacterized protein n=2 Tax=Caudoviricetes TaxID=2731619 RepID=A0A345MHZ2_9CAUD|nr:hypothetical protein HOT74_gp62 [Microbacterium phage KaiHaiDragon]URM86268.1 hypothetical protein SEA_KOWALSKI_59 [Microbacterium phage Kowalski]URM86877.1 hypothetical protein SEA_RAMIEL05_59 [Microbacterium phage Ramiel05]UVG34536.1 hypothetical protein EARICKHC_61 [Microbacterium phage EarickHC]WGH20649.1 hypothetical protein SEA_BRAZZALEPHS_59 [Microbacterium phage BrazzalePHS]AXH70173.1 hypothetical protein SEA_KAIHAIDRAGON_61 [Microbacterium phage KaiHaiDragon]